MAPARCAVRPPRGSSRSSWTRSTGTSQAAMAGAIGDKQAVGGFLGVNAALFAEAIERKVVVAERRLALRDLPLGKAVAQSIDPYFRGLSGRPEAAAEFLRAAGIDPEMPIR